MNFIRHMHATLNQIYVYVLSRTCCGHRINNNTLWLWYEFFSLDKKTNRQADSACGTLALLQVSLSVFHCHIDHYSVHYMTYHVEAERERETCQLRKISVKNWTENARNCFNCFPSISFCIIYYNGTHVIYTVLDQYI
jgi:hypothetical protein